MRTLQLSIVVCLGLAGCQEAATSTDGSADTSGDPCSLPASFQLTSANGSGGALIIAPDGRTAWSVLGIGEGTGSLDGRQLIVDFSAPAHQFQVRADLGDQCQAGQGVMQIVRWPDGQTGETPVTIAAGRPDAYMDYPHLRPETGA